jgi:hypothetical protein
MLPDRTVEIKNCKNISLRTKLLFWPKSESIEDFFVRKYANTTNPVPVISSPTLKPNKSIPVKDLPKRSNKKM